MVDMPIARCLGRRFHIAAREKPVVGGGRSPTLGPTLDVLQLHAENGALNPFHPIVETLEDMVIFLFRTPVPEHTKLALQFWIVGDHHAGFTVGTEVLARIE